MFLNFHCVLFRFTREFFTHMETLLLPVKGCKCLAMIYTHIHRGPMTLTPNVERLAIELSLPV